MILRAIVVTCLVTMAGVATVRADEPVDLDVITKIR